VILRRRFSSNGSLAESRDRGVQSETVPRRDGKRRVDDLDRCIDERTKIISVSWVGYASGFANRSGASFSRGRPRAGRVWFFLMRFKGWGSMPLDSKRGCDFLVGRRAQWMLGPEGAGVASFGDDI